jgi:RteC protein
MNSVWEGLPVHVRATLAEMEEGADPVGRYQDCKIFLEEVITGMKISLRRDAFPDREAEIRYFKVDVPAVYGAHMYYLKLLYLEMTGQYLDRERFKALLKTELQATDDFFARHAELLRYTESHDPSWQTCLYTRRGQGEWLPEETAVYIGEDMTIGSYWTARKRASAGLRWWIWAKLANLEDEGIIPPGMEKGKPGLSWTSAIIDLAEVVYALHLKGSFNHGKVTLKEVMEWFAQQFGVNLDNFHARLNEIGQRKKVDKFLRELASALNEKYDSKL